MIAGFGIKTIDDEEIIDKRVLLKVDFNVSLTEEFTIADDARIQQALPTINKLLKNHNRLILVSHFGRPKGRDPHYSLKIVAKHLQSLLNDYTVTVVDDFQSPEGKNKLLSQKNNEVFMLENIRFYKGEKENDEEFARELAGLADIFVNDAFGAIHRAHASVVGITQFLPSYAGLLLKNEIEMLSHVVQNPQRPLVAIIGGSKISTKIKLISKLMHLSDYILVGGGLANTFLKAKGHSIGKSLHEAECVDVAKTFLAEFEKNSCRLLLPQDAAVGNPHNPNQKSHIYKVEDIPDDMWILDIGPETQAEYGAAIHKAKTIVWNGPVGLFESPQYRGGTDFIYYTITNTEGAVSIVGGGDTLAAISNKEYLEKITHISTGGGAMLEFIEKGTLPGIEALGKQHNNT